MVRETNFQEEALQEALEKIDRRDNEIRKVEDKIKDLERQVAGTEKDYSWAQDEIKRMRRALDEERRRKSQGKASIEAHPSINPIIERSNNLVRSTKTPDEVNNLRK